MEGPMIVGALIALVSLTAGFALGLTIGKDAEAPSQKESPLKTGADAPKLEPHYPTAEGYAAYQAARKKNPGPWTDKK